jgi:HNH endonuclease
LNLRKGWFKASSGYIYIWEPEHPNSNKKGYVGEHTKVMAAELGRPLLAGEEVHHRNRQRDDNRPENLELWTRGQQPPGARVNDLVVEAVRILRLYAPEKLSENP